MYDYHDRAYPFRVAAGESRERYGLSLNGEWRIGSTTESTIGALRQLHSQSDKWPGSMVTRSA
jgi:hypothetical protein